MEHKLPLGNAYTQNYSHTLDITMETYSHDAAYCSIYIMQDLLFFLEKHSILTLSTAGFTQGQQLSSTGKAVNLDLFSLSLELLILDYACWYLNESSLHEESEYYVIVIVIGMSVDIQRDMQHTVITIKPLCNILVQYDGRTDSTEHTSVTAALSTLLLKGNEANTTFHLHYSQKYITHVIYLYFHLQLTSGQFYDN